MRHITAEEYYTLHNEDVTMNIGVFDQHSFTLQIMIDFAKYHVTKALKQVSEEATTDGYGDGYADVDREGILELYPLNNIK